MLALLLAARKEKSKSVSPTANKPHPVIGIQKQVDGRYPRIVLGLLRQRKRESHNRRRKRRQIRSALKLSKLVNPYSFSSVNNSEGRSARRR